MWGYRARLPPDMRRGVFFSLLEFYATCLLFGKQIAAFRKLPVAFRRADRSLVDGGGLFVVGLYNVPTARGCLFYYFCL